VAAIESPGISGEHSTHHAGQWPQPSAQEEMKMVWQEGPGDNLEP